MSTSQECNPEFTFFRKGFSTVLNYKFEHIDRRRLSRVFLRRGVGSQRCSSVVERTRIFRDSLVPKHTRRDLWP